LLSNFNFVRRMSGKNEFFQHGKIGGK